MLEFFPLLAVKSRYHRYSSPMLPALCLSVDSCRSKAQMLWHPDITACRGRLRPGILPRGQPLRTAFPPADKSCHTPPQPDWVKTGPRHTATDLPFAARLTWRSEP